MYFFLCLNKRHGPQSSLLIIYTSWDKLKIHKVLRTKKMFWKRVQGVCKLEPQLIFTRVRGHVFRFIFLLPFSVAGLLPLSVFVFFSVLFVCLGILEHAVHQLCHDSNQLLWDLDFFRVSFLFFFFYLESFVGFFVSFPRSCRFLSLPCQTPFSVRRWLFLRGSSFSSCLRSAPVQRYHHLLHSSHPGQHWAVLTDVYH